MRSKTLFVWLTTALSALILTLVPQSAEAQINATEPVVAVCIEDSNGLVAPNGVIDELGDMLRLTARAAYVNRYCDSAAVGLDPTPDLGVLIPALYPTMVVNCPAGPSDVMYRMDWVVTPHMGLAGPINPANWNTNLDSCLVVATIEFHPEGVSVSAGELLSFGITWLGWDDTPAPNGTTVCADNPYTIAAPCDIQSGCSFIQYREGGGIAFDGIVAINDTVWLDSALASTIDTMPVGDTLLWNGSGLTCDPADANLFAGDTIIVQPCRYENGLVNACTNDTIWLYYYQWDPQGEEGWPFDAVLVDSIPCVRPVDNSPPTLDQVCIDSCGIVQLNYLDNDTIAGCGDFFRIYLSTVQNGFPTQNNPAHNCDGDSVLLDIYNPMFNGWGQDCDTVSQNFDVSWMAVDFHDIVPPGYKFPMNEDSINLLSLDSVWVSVRFGNGPNPGAANDLMWVDIPISCDSTHWDSVEFCILEGLLNGDTIYVYSLDDAGNPSNPVHFGDTTGTLTGCDVCLDNQPPQLPGSDTYWTFDGVDNYCNQRFSPYDSALATAFTNLSPDSIRWYLDGVDSVYDVANYIHVLQKVYLIGFDVRVIPDDNPDTPTGAIITALDYYHPMAAPDSVNWDWRSPYVGIDSSACFTWYGKNGPDSLDPNLNMLAQYCPWGMLVGITEARYMDAGGCNAVLGSDHDGSTDILDGYTQLNNLYAVVDSCFPTTTIPLDLVAPTFYPQYPIGPDYPPASIVDPYLWTNGDPLPFVQFKARRYYTQGLLDTCLAEDLCYTVRLDSIYTQGVWPFITDSIYYTQGDPSNGSHTRYCEPISFFFNDINSDTIRFQWGMRGPNNQLLPDGLYCLTLELQDNAGNVYRGDQVCMWINGLGPAIDSVNIVNESNVCNMNFFAGESLCVYMRTDTSAQFALFDFSCILNIDSVAAAYDSIWVNAPVATDNATYKIWRACLMVDLGMIDTADVSNNDYQIDDFEADCENSGTYGIIRAIAFDSDSNFTQATNITPTCNNIALLGESRCPRIVGPIEFYFLDPDTLDAVAGSEDGPFADFNLFGEMPLWNAFSPGSVDSNGAYDAILNPAHDQVHDSIFVRILIDTLSITQADNFGAPFNDDVYHDTLVVEFRNTNTVPTRSRIVRKPLFVTQCVDLDGSLGCEDPPQNSVYFGRLENNETNNGLMEFRYMWNGTWFINAGTDSQMLVPITGQDTILVLAWTINGDSAQIIGMDTIYMVCDTTVAQLDVDNENPEFLEWTGIPAGTRDPATHSTATVNNDGWDGDCGFRYAEGDTFQLTVRASEQVHYDPAAYPNVDGSSYAGAVVGQWNITGNWQISLVDSTAGLLINNGPAPGTYIQVELISVAPESLAGNEWEYTLTGRIFNMPPDTFIYNACFVIRGAWDQGGNPGRYNSPAFSDAYEADSFEDTTFCLHLIPCDPWAAGCPDVFGPDSIMGWIAPEDTNITVCATIIETCELTECLPGVKADSLRVVEGDFQRITDDPNPWVVPDSVGDWFIYIDGLGNEIGWARMYYWFIRADSSDLATIWCDGDYLDFEIRFVSWEGVRDSMTFDDCVQVDVNEPLWTQWSLLDSNGIEMDDFALCIEPEQAFTLVGCVWDSEVDCPDGEGVGVDPTKLWADLSQLLQDATMDSVPPDSYVVFGTFTGVYPYVGGPVPIQDNTTSNAFINDPDAGAILDVNITLDVIEHTWIGDLNISLESPNGTIVLLKPSNIAYSGDNLIDVTFDDEAALPFPAPPGTAPFTGTWQPAGNLSDFDGENPNGTWTLIVSDVFGADEGFIRDWTLEVTYRTGPDLKVVAYWNFTPDSTFFCLNSVAPWFRFHAAHDLIGHHDRELYMQDTLNFCSDCLPPEIFTSDAYCECDTALADLLMNNPVWDLPANLPYLSFGSEVTLKIAVFDANHDSSLGLPEGANVAWADLSVIDTNYAWEGNNLYAEVDLAPPVLDTACYIWGLECYDLNPGPLYILNNPTYHNGDTIFVNFAIVDNAGNADTILWPIAIYDSLPPIVDFIYTIGDDSVRAYVTPGDEHVHIYADINGYAADLVSAPEHVWANFSRFWCDPIMQAAYDTVHAHEIVDLGGGNYRAYWGWTPSGVYLTPGDTLSQITDTLRIDPDYSCHLIGAEGTFDSLWIYVTDVACNMGSHFNIFEFSGADTTVPDVDSVWVMGSDSCAPGWFDGNSGEWIYVWAWMDSLFNGFEDTLRIDSLMADLSGFGPAYAWTAFTPNFGGGAPAYGVAPNMNDDVPGWWEIETDCNGMTRLVAKWIVRDPQFIDCGQTVIVPVKGQRQTGLGGSHGYYLDVEYGTGTSFTAEYLSSVAWGDFTVETGFPGNPDINGVDSVLVLQNSVYGLDWDSVLTVAVLMDNNCVVSPGDTVYDWSGVWIDFTGFLTDWQQYPDVVYYNVYGNNIDSLVFIIPLYDDMGGGPLFNVNIPSNRYWWSLHLSDTLCNMPEEFCNAADLDSVISFTIQNWNEPNPGMILLCDSNTVACSDTDYVDAYNMALWNDEKVSPDTERENLYKIYTAPGEWYWYSHEENNTTRFFIFVQDSVLQCDGIDNDNDGTIDEIGEGVDFYTADLRINTMPQVAHVDSMNVNGVWIDYLWYADNFSERRYDVKLFISDIYGHRDSLTCDGDFALTFFEDESCPFGDEMFFWKDGEPVQVRKNLNFESSFVLDELTADDSLFIFSNFDSLVVWARDPALFDANGHPGSGLDLSPDNSVDSTTWNGTSSSTIELLDPFNNVVASFTQTFYDDTLFFDVGPLTLSDATDNLENLSDGRYTVRVTILDRLGNSCDYQWSFILDRTCPAINDAYVSRPGLNTPVTDLYTSWDYVEIYTHIDDSLDGVDSVIFEYAFDANRDGNVDAYTYWQNVNLLTDEGQAWDTEYPFNAYWNIRNLPWSSEDTLGLPPVNPDGSCTNRYFVRVRAFDIYGHECIDTFAVDITDDIAPLAYISTLTAAIPGPGGGPQGSLVACFNPNTMTDSTIFIIAEDYIAPDLFYDPIPGDTFTVANRWFDLYEGVFQYKFFNAPNAIIPGNTDPSLGWVNILSGLHGDAQDTITARHNYFQDFSINWNIANLGSGQYNLRMVAFDVCGNYDYLNTPVITFRVECDTTAPMALVCFPEPDMCVTNIRCDEPQWVPVQAVAPLFADVDSIAFFFVDSLSIPGLGIHTFIGGSTNPDSISAGLAYYSSTGWNTNNLLSGYYWLYAVAYDTSALFDSDPIWSRVFVDNTMPQVTECWVGEPWWDEFVVVGTKNEGETFALRANVQDNIGLDMACGISGVQFQILDRFGNWRNLENDLNEETEIWGAELYLSDGDGFIETPDAAGYYEIHVAFYDFGNSPLDSVRFRAYAIDDVDWGDNNMQGDYNRDCNLDRDLECGSEICCMAIEIRDRIPDGTNLWCYNHGWYSWGVPQFTAPSTPIYDGDKFSTCNYQNPLDTLMFIANVADYVEDEWLMYFKFWRADGTTDTFDIPNDYTLNPALPRNADSAIVLQSTYDTVGVIWSNARAWLDSADAADGLVYSRWDFAAYVVDVTGNIEWIGDQNSCYIYTFCPPNTPITDVSYVTNDVNNPENRVRVTEPVEWQDAITDTIEVLYNRTTDPGSNDPEALVLFYVDADAIRNCHGDSVQVFNIELWMMSDDTTLQAVCDGGPIEVFDFFNDFRAWDQFPPDAGTRQYEFGVYFDNSYPPGTYNFSAVVNYIVYAPFANDTLNEGDTDCDGFIEGSDSTRLDLVVRIVNVNEPQVVFCYPPYGDACGAHNTIPLSANDVSDPSYFSGEIDTVWFQRWNGSAWVPVFDAITGLTYDAYPGEAYVRFQFDERELPGMAGWYYERHSNPIYSWYAERDLFPDVAIYIWNTGQFYPMSEVADGFWQTDIYLDHGDNSCYDYSIVIDANDNNVWDEPGIDRWIDDPRNIDWNDQEPIAYDRCSDDQEQQYGESSSAYSTICLCEYVINFNSLSVGDGHHEFRTVVGWHDELAYHVIENPAPGDSLHVFFVDNDAPVATHDIEFDNFWVNGGRCDESGNVHFVTDIQPIDGNYNLVVEDICAVIYQVSLTSNPELDSSWVNVDTVYASGGQGWIEAWASFWTAYDPTADNIDNDGDGLVDETYDVQGGDGRGEENTLFYSRSIVVDHCGNTYIAAAESIWVDVSEARACISLVGDVEPGVNGNDVVVIPDNRDLVIVATNQDYAGFDPSILGVFQYRTLNPIGPWTNIQADTLSNDTVRHVGNTLTATWDLLSFFQETGNDPEGWYQLRVIAIDTVGNTDLCDNDVCYITIRLNDIQPAARIELYQVINANEEIASSCTSDSILYIHAADPYCLQAIFAPTNIDTGLASLTFQYAAVNNGVPSNWRNIETIWDQINHGLDGDTTRCVYFQPQPQDVGDQEIFWLRVIVEDYNGNDTSDVKVLYVDALPPTGTSTAQGTAEVATACGDRCWFEIQPGQAIVWVDFDPDQLSNEINVDQVWMTAVREDGNYAYNFGYLTRSDDDEWYFDFGGDLCNYWLEHRYESGEGGQYPVLDYGCYTFTIHFTDCQGNEDSVVVTTTCGEEATDLICIDCYPTVPEHTDILYMDYSGYDCVDGEYNSLRDDILDGTTEIGGDQSVEICGVIASYEQDVHYVVLYVESQAAGVAETAVDTFWWDPTFASHLNPNWCLDWWLADTTDEGAAKYPSGYYRVWVRAHDAICQIEPTEMLDEFWVYVDHAEPVGDITEVNGVPATEGNFTYEVNAGDEDPVTLWVQWTDGLVPNDSTQTNNIVQVWCKNIWHPNQADAWTSCGYIPSPCNPHYVELDLSGISCGDSIHVVAIVQDRWGNGDLDVSRVMEAFDGGHFVNIYIYDTTPPSSMLWSVGTSEEPWCDDGSREQGVDGLWIVDQQTRTVSLGALGDIHDIWLHSFAATGDESISRVYFEYSVDGGNTWFEIGMDEDGNEPCEWGGNEPAPWWDGLDHDVFWTVVWDVSGLAGDVLVRTWAEDECGNLEETEIYTVSFDVQAPMARVYVWENGVNINNLETCDHWTEPQIGDEVERFSLLTIGACADEEEADAYGAHWFIKRAEDHPLEMWSWCFIGDDSTGPFSVNDVDLWHNDCPAPQPGLWYDIAVLTTDQAGNELTWTQFLNYGQGTTVEEKWAWLMANGYVKRFYVSDTVAPMAFDLITAPDCTPDSSVIFLHGDITLQAQVNDEDVVAVTFAFLEVGSNGPWTVIERVTGNPGLFGPVEGYWNTELLNGTYWVGAFAEDNFGNMNGNLTIGADGAPNALLQVNVDNQAPVATILSVWRTDDPTQTPVTQLERGAEVTFHIEAEDNFSIRKVRFYYRHTNGDPNNWIQVGGDRTWPFSFNWVVPTDLVVGWNYDFAAVAVDYCEQTDQYDAQGNYIIDWTAPIVDEEANISIVAINDFLDVEGTPHVHGTEICIYANSEPTLDYVRFLFVTAQGDTHEIRTVSGYVGQTEWSNCQGSGSYWDVTTLPEGPGQLCAIGSADIAGQLVTVATDCRNIVIDHSLPWVLQGNLPSSRGLIGGYCEFNSNNENGPEDLWVRFNNELTDNGIDTVWFEWKWAADPNDPNFWSSIGYAYQDLGVTGNWVYSWNVYNAFQGTCGTISLRAVMSDNAIPESNLAYVLFADSVRVDNCPPTVMFTNVNGDLTPDQTVIPWGEVINMVATAEDVFGNGGNSNISRVCFYGEEDTSPDLISCDEQGPLWSAQLATTALTPNSWYTLVVVAWDQAGNCSEHMITVYIEDSQFQRACIVGFDDDNEFGCSDYLYAVTDDCDPNWTDQVQFQVSINQGQTWIPLSDAVNTRQDQCNDWLGWHLWQVTLEFDLYPANAWFRAVAWDESGNIDPNPPIWRRQDVSVTTQTQIWAPDWVRVPSNGEMQPWVLTTLEDYTENCLIEAGVVCIEPEAGSSFYAGELPLNTRPCELEDEDGRIKVFSSNKIQQGDNVFIQMVTYAMDIHKANYQGGSNGTLVSEDGVLEVTIPAWGTGWRGSLWFQPYLPSQTHSMVPAYQYYYTLISAVEEIQSDDLGDIDIEQAPSSFRMRFDNSLLPENAEEWQVVVAYWNWDADDESGQYNGMWQEWGITYNDRDLENGIVDFQMIPDWDVSDLTNICPDRIRFGVFLTTIRPIDEFVRMNSGDNCHPWFDNPYYNGLPVVDCTPMWWVVLGEGETPPTPDRVDVWLDGIRIVNDGEPVELDGYNYDNCYYDELFDIEYDNVSGIFSVEFNPNYGSCPPWFGCLTQGVHTIQFYVDNRPTRVTEFYVDNTLPTAYTEPTYIGDVNVTLWADLIDRESGIDTQYVYLDLRNCEYDGGDYVHEITSEALTFQPILENGVQIGVRASITVQWDGLIDGLFSYWYDEESGSYSIENCPLTLCAHWHVYNNVCLENESTHDYRYTVDIVPPVITPVSPVGAPIDDDGDGVANEDVADCTNNDGDVYWSNGWVARYDEDPINFEEAVFNCGERPVIQASISDWARCCFGASGVDLSAVRFWIDDLEFSAADTSVAGLNFRIVQPGQNDFVFTIGGPNSGEAADLFYTPGDHRITIAVPDNAGNIGTMDHQNISWTWHVDCPGPSVEFDDTECGAWFNPESQPGNPQDFGFTVRTVGGAAIAPNGISYTVVTIPDRIRISGPTTIDPAGRDEVEVTFTMDGSFPDGQTGLSIEVETRNIFFVSGSDNGYNMSARTYWADNCAPTDVAHFPATGDSVMNEGNVVVELRYSDDCGGALASIGGDATLAKGATRMLNVSGKDAASNKSETRIDRDGDGTLDDNGSGIVPSRVWFVVVPPRGPVQRYENAEDFIERTTSSAKIVLVDPIAGLWTVNGYAEDCVGNLLTTTWTFRVLSTGPIVVFGDVEEGSCQYNGFWNPDYPLDFTATVTENDGANVRNGDISVRFIGLYDCNGSICERDLTANVNLNVTPAYSNQITDQVFTVMGSATFGNFGGNGTPTDVRIILTARDQYGTVREVQQTWVVDDAKPIVEAISPLPGSVVNGDLPVTISGRFFDDEDYGSAAGMPGGDATLLDKNVAPASGFIGGVSLKGSDDKGATTFSTTKLDLGAWREALTRGVTSLDGNSGIDLACIEFRLHNHRTGQYTDLMEGATIGGGVITWSGNLSEGPYTVVLTVCDRVCNTESRVWDFVVINGGQGGSRIVWQPPFHVSAMPHCFKALLVGDAFDRTTVRMTLEGAMMVEGQLIYAPIVVDAPVNFSGDTAIYCANFDLTGLLNIRATLGGQYYGGIAFPSSSQVYTVDTGRPVFTAVQPDPSVILPILSSPEFRVDFAEVGTTGLDPASVRLWLTTAGGENVANNPTVSIAPNGLTGFATLRPAALAVGNYVLHAEVSDLAGNSASATWNYRVGQESPIVDGETYNYPNPFTKADGYTTFHLPLGDGSSGGAMVSIKIYDFSGRYVTTVWDGVLNDPNTPITWNGTNANGEEVANGVYLANVEVSGGGKSVKNIVKVAYKKADN